MSVSPAKPLLSRVFVPMVVLAAVVGLASCGGSGDGGGSGSSADSQTVYISLTDAGCQPSHVELHAGAVTFVVSNPHSSRVQSFAILAQGRSNPLGEVTNVLGGLARNLDADLQPGSYILRCRQNNLGGDAGLIVAK
ncbi:MAG: cupredoxin domain-containing protein [Dehalococcoidia bacterium]|nr:cupredoxin domain-containing protein [Dehalococcoidia bacterium]